MKSFRFFLLSLVTAALVAPLSAQPSKSSVIKTVETARVAYINSNAFLDARTGLKKLVRVNQALELEFGGTQSELALMNEKLRTLAGELNKLAAEPITNAAAISEKQAQGQRLQQELASKQQAAQEAYAKRAQETQAPVAAEIGQELRAFAKERDVSMLFDLAKLGDAVLDAKTELDLTPDFIGYFNGRHP